MDVVDLNRLTPAEYRARYEALQAAARAKAGGAAPAFQEQAAGIFRAERVPAGGYVTLRLKRWDVLRVANPSGTAGAALFFWNADETSERFNAGDTTKLQWTTNLTTGRVLFSDMGRVMFSIVGDTGAGHDSILGPSAAGVRNLRLGAAKFGLTRRDVAAALSLFSAVRTDDEGRFVYGGAPPAGAAVDLRAEMTLLVVLSNTTHALAPAGASGAIDYSVRHEVPGDDDYCRGFTEEARRGFDNTDGEFA
jgi:uncharacterized protein YcgI (DUF1989 family)